jgi:hypothetical protein
VAKNRDNAADSDLLHEIRENYKYYLEAWREIREEARTDMQYIAGDPWDPKDRKLREDNDRPCMTWDELNPYINKLLNDPKQNPRAIQVNPKGNGANDRTAEFRGNLIREIEYNSRAQQAFTTAFQGGVERSYGWARVGKRYVTSVATTASTDSFNQELYIGRIPNPDSVVIDPNYKEMDASDMMGAFVTDIMRIEDFKRDYPNAEKTAFTDDDRGLAQQWIWDNQIQVAEYWKVRIEKKKLLLFKGGEEGATAYFEDELPAGFDIAKADDNRSVDKRVVTQYITNGVEILDETQIEIPWIPLIPVFGKEIWVDDGGGAKRKLISLVRMARDPFMAYCFYRSQEAEEAGMTPKSPFLVYKGQINPSDKEAWATVNKVPRAYLEVEPVLDQTGTTVLPLPTRPQFTPNFQSYEVACEAARRAIQTAMSGSVLPTQAQRMNEKSGVALKQIDAQEDQGTFHFIDNYNTFLEHTGRILDAWIPFVYDTKREVGIRKPDGTHQSIAVNDPTATNKAGDPDVWDAKTGEHGVTISVGPSEDSQRDAVSAFVDTLITNLTTLPIPPPQMAKILALAIKMKQLGPIGDEIADVISPPPDQAAQQQQQMQQAQAMQQQQELMQKMQEELGKLRLEKAGKVIDNEYALKLAAINNDVKVLIANTTTMQQNLSERMEMFAEYWKETHGAAAEAALQANQHAHEKDQAATAAQTQSNQSAQDHGQAQEQQVTAAALQPQPEPSANQ